MLSFTLFVCLFQTNEFDFVVVSLHVKALHFSRRKKADKSDEDNEKVDHTRESQRTNAEVTQLAPLVTVLKEKLANERDIVLLGDFNMPPGDNGELLNT